MKTIRRICYIITAILLAFIVFVIGVYIHVKSNEHEQVIQSPNTGAYGADAIGYAITHTVGDVDLPDLTVEYADDTAKLLGADVPFIAISDDDRYIVECVVAGEAGGHSYELMKAVAQCMAVSMDIEGMTADELRAAHQYSGWNPGFEKADSAAWALVEAAVSDVFDHGNLTTYSLIQYFYNPEHGGSSFHEQMHYVMTIDGVRFFSRVEV